MATKIAERPDAGRDFKTAKLSKSDVQDLRTHLKTLEQNGLLVRITREINKDTELGPLARWQFRGLAEEDRKGFLFENLVDSQGRRFQGGSAIGIYAASSTIYGLGMGCAPEEVRDRWLEAQATPIPPVIVDDGPVHEEVHMGDDLLAHGGLSEFAIPVNTPGFDIAPYTSASNWVTRDQKTGWYNVGNYRGQIKGPARMGICIHARNHGGVHWDQVRADEQDIETYAGMEAALVIGGPPALLFCAGARIPYGTQEYDVAGSLIGEPLQLVRAKSVDLLVPAYAEIVIEGRISTEWIEPEAPFGEYTGYMGQRIMAMVFEVTAITHRKDPIFCTLLSQMPPSESSKVKSIAHNANYLHYLRNQCNLPDVVDVTVAEIAVDSWAVIRMRPCNPAMQWQALYAFLGRNTTIGKFVVVVDEDIDPADFESVVWALSYRMQPEHDMKVLTNRAVSLDPSGLKPSDDIKDMSRGHEFSSVVLINAMRKWKYPPVSLPAKQYMENARKIWEELGLPELKPRMPWHGYELGDWSDRDRQEAEWAVKGEYHRTGDRAKQQRKKVDEV